MAPEPRVPRIGYFRYNAFPTNLVPVAGAYLPVAWRFSLDTGGWRRDDDAIVDLQGNSRADVFELDRDGFIQLTELTRAEFVRGEGPVFALYETLRAIEEQARDERRPLTDRERQLIRGISRKTYAMFERDLAARGDPGADPDPES